MAGETAFRRPGEEDPALVRRGGGGWDCRGGHKPVLALRVPYGWDAARARGPAHRARVLDAGHDAGNGLGLWATQLTITGSVHGISSVDGDTRAMLSAGWDCRPDESAV